MIRSTTWLALLLAATSCAGMKARAERERLLTQRLDEFRYSKPLEEVWQEARRLLAANGYPLADPDAKAVDQPPMSWADSLVSPAQETQRRADDVGLLQRRPQHDSNAPLDDPFLETGWKYTGDRYRIDGYKDARGCRVVFKHITQDRTDHRDVSKRDLEMELQLVARVEPDAAATIEAAMPPGS